MAVIPTASSESVRERMRRQKGRNTKPELLIRSELHRRGLRYRVDYRAVADSRSRVDIAFTRQRLAVFVDGCFWHSCPEHGSEPASNAEWWRDKLGANVHRDRRVDCELESAGWRVLRIWEHESVSVAVERILSALTSGTRSEDVSV